MTNVNNPRFLSPWQIVRQEFECPHTHSELRYKLDRIERKFFVYQCLECGDQTSSAVRKTTINDPGTIPPFDTNLEAAYEARKRDRYEELRANKESEWWTWYNQYLASPEWRRKRSRVLKRDRYICQACLENRATEVHHLSYRHVGREPLFELTSVCNTCHAALTEQDAEIGNND